jgi:type I restriction enzyme S subunit
MKGTTVMPFDILLNITGGSIGRCALVGNEIDEANINQHVAIIRPVFSDVRRYFHAVLMSPYFQKKIESVQTGAGREGLPKNKMDRIAIPLPPYFEQNAIVDRVDELMASCRALEEEIERAKEQSGQLLQAVLKEAFATTSS